MYNARSVYKELGYKKWENFQGIVIKAEQLIKNGLHNGNITKSKIKVDLAKGAKRDIVDWTFDENAFDLVRNICGNMKLVNGQKVRNEIEVLNLLKKYCEYRSIIFEFQYALGKYRFDCIVGKTLIEFDEPHHLSKRSIASDLIKEGYANSMGYSVVKVDVFTDIIDLIKILKL